MISDLLNPSSGYLELREDAKGEIQIAGITEFSTCNAKEVQYTDSFRAFAVHSFPTFGLSTPYNVSKKG